MRKFVSIILSIAMILISTGCNNTVEITTFSFLLLNFDNNICFDSAQLDEGDIIELGYYDHKPLEWIVLRIEDGKMLVLSKYGLFGEDNEHREFGSILAGEYTWEESSVREFLNSDYLLWTLFTENEQAVILDTEIETDDNPQSGVNGGRSTTDKLFLLSIFDVLENFEDASEAECELPNGDDCAWWLRTPGDREGYMSFIDRNGNPDLDGVGVSTLTTPGTMSTYSILTLRPAMWVALDDNDDRVYDDYEDNDGREYTFFCNDATFNKPNGIDFDSLSEVSNTSNITVGSTVEMGSLEGQQLSWTVLDIVDDKALVLCDYGIAYIYLNSTERVYTWETCEIRAMLNSAGFLNAVFTSSEQSIIVRSSVVNDDNPDYGTSGGNDTSDLLFILSVNEALNYLSYSNQSRCQAAPFLTQADGGYWYWWLRTPGYINTTASIVQPDGVVNTGGTYANVDASVLLRPAMWIRIS